MGTYSLIPTLILTRIVKFTHKIDIRLLEEDIIEQVFAVHKG